MRTRMTFLLQSYLSDEQIYNLKFNRKRMQEGEIEILCGEDAHLYTNRGGGL